MSALTLFAYKRDRGIFSILVTILVIALMHPTQLAGQERVDTLFQRIHVDTLETVTVNATKLIIDRRIDKTVVKTGKSKIALLKTVSVEVT